ncbi:MAG TPA: hypothetical protein VG123_11925 [Streptosporangiaceae bacterium]|jgi:hypothetical protein|nr:hypothetical protein [Streptosporangiaceae bacterium]
MRRGQEDNHDHAVARRWRPPRLAPAPLSASCRLLTTYRAPYQVENDWTGIQIAVCTHPLAGWPTLWPHLKHYG